MSSWYHSTPKKSRENLEKMGIWQFQNRYTEGIISCKRSCWADLWVVGGSKDRRICLPWWKERTEQGVSRKIRISHTAWFYSWVWIIGERMLVNRSLYYVEQFCKTPRTSGGLPAPLTIFSSIIVRTFSFGSPMPTAMYDSRGGWPT